MVLADQTSVVNSALNAINRQLTAALVVWHKRLGMRVVFTALMLAVIAGGGVFLNGTTFAHPKSEWLQVCLAAAILATVASLITAAMLYPLLRQGDLWLIDMAASLAGDSIDRLFMLGKLTELRSRETAGHNLRVTFYTLKFAEALGLSPEAAACATKGALVHDIGKFAVPDRILRKSGPLTAEERQEIEAHVPAGMAILMQSRFFNDALKVVAYHHEYFDGKGYPHGLQGESIPLEARIFALIDVFDALTSPRVYKQAIGIEEALATMSKGRGSHFDPILFDRFVELAPRLASQLPTDENVLIAMLTDHLTPYLDIFLLGRKLLNQKILSSQ